MGRDEGWERDERKVEERSRDACDRANIEGVRGQGEIAGEGGDVAFDGARAADIDRRHVDNLKQASEPRIVREQASEPRMCVNKPASHECA
jgi:hypothetical protein